MAAFVDIVSAPIVAAVLRGVVGCAQQGFRLFGLAVIFIAAALITCVVYTQAHLVVPAVYPRGSAGYWAAMGLTLWASTGVWLNYLTSLGRDPGVIPRGFRYPNLPELHYPPRGYAYSSASYNGPRVRGCEGCDVHKPPRAHHCSLCGHCVEKMDHHCPWINSCVGYRNQRAFLSFLLYLLAGTAYCGAHSAYVLFRSDIYPPALTGSGLVMFAAIICAALHVAMWLFVGWNGFLALTNQTAIEFQINSAERDRAARRGETYRSPFDLGPWGNFVDLFATKGEDYRAYVEKGPLPPAGRLRSAASRGFFWARRAWHIAYLTFPTLQPMPGDGRTFRTNHEAVARRAAAPHAA